MKFRTLLSVSVAALGALGMSSALAADLPVKKAPPAPTYFAPPPYNWTGFYLGANAGVAFGTGSTNVTGSAGFTGLGSAYVPGKLGTSSAGFIGGIEGGYNYQVGQLVLGVETDFDGTSAGKTAHFTGAVTPLGTSLTTTAKSRLDWLGTTRVRLGTTLTPDNRLLAFVSGGLAYGGTSTSGSVVGNGTNLAWYGSHNPNPVGFALGAGAEYAITNNVAIKGEYLYYDLGRVNNTAPGNAAVAGTAALNGVYLTTKTNYNGSILRAGVDFKF